MKDKLTVGLFVDTFYPMVDGVVISVDSVIPLLSKYVDLVVFTAAPSNKKYDDSCFKYKITRCRSMKMPFVKTDYDMPIPKMDKKFLKEIKNSKLDLVHIHSPFGIGKAGLQYAKRNKIPAVITLHSQYKQDFYNHTHSKLLSHLFTKVIMRVYNSTTECWSVNHATKEILYEYGIKKEPFVMENGVNMLPIEDKASAMNEINSYHKISEIDNVLLFVGRIVALKNIFFIADVLKELDSKGFNFKMIFIGDGVDMKVLIKKIESLNLASKVIFTGRISDRNLLAKYYARSDLFIFPSFYDTDGVVKKEAASQKTPMICIEGSTVSKTVIKNRNAYVAPNNISEFADEVISALSNKEKYNMIAENAYNEIYITWEVTAKKTYDRYQELIEENHKNAK